MAEREDARIVYEPTGPYHRTFERRLAEAGLALIKFNPRQARRFAEATGRLAKTDRLDAAMLARMLVTTGMIQSALKVSRQGALDLIGASSLREMTGRGRYKGLGGV